MRIQTLKEFKVLIYSFSSEDPKPISPFQLMEEMSSVVRSQEELSGFDRDIREINGSEFVIFSSHVHAQITWSLREGEKRRTPLPYCINDICLEEATLMLI